MRMEKKECKRRREKEKRGRVGVKSKSARGRGSEGVKYSLRMERKEGGGKRE